MERSSADAWYESYVNMLEDYIENNRPRLYHLLPWLSRTHDNLGDASIKQNLYVYVCVQHVSHKV